MEHSCHLCRINVQNLNVNMDAGSQLENVNLHIHCGENTVLIGPNGAGKTTLIRALLRQIPFSGELAHLDAKGKPFPRLKIGYVPQELHFDRTMPLTVKDFLAANLVRRPVFFGVSQKTKKVIAAMLQKVHAETLMDKQLGKLSGGEMQRVLLALALHPMPDLLILDEPISGIDKNGQTLFLELIRDLKQSRHIAILMVLHDHQIVRRFADSVILLDKTVLASGSPQEVYESAAFKAAFPLESREADNA